MLQNMEGCNAGIQFGGYILHAGVNMYPGNKGSCGFPGVIRYIITVCRKIPA
jgi:hypothetical protein